MHSLDRMERSARRNFGLSALRLSGSPEDRRGTAPAERTARERHTALAVGPRSLLLALPLGLLALTGCKPVGPNYSRPGFHAPASYKETGASSVVPPPNPQGGNWKPANPSDGMIRGKWWEIYKDPELDKLEDRVSTDNVQLKQALDNYLAAREEVAVARANFYPTLSAAGQISRSRGSYNQPGSPSPSKLQNNIFLLEGQASWEPDFFGRIRRLVEENRANAQVSAAVMANLNLTLHAELATDYFELRGLDSEAKLLRDTVADLRGQLELTQRLLAGGVDTAVDVAQAQTQLDNVSAQLVEVGVARAQYEHAIGTLDNVNLSSFSLPFSPLDMPLPKVPLGVPSQLLERRPDIAASERAVDAANAQIGIAISAFYPTIPIVATGGFESTHPGTWIQGPSSLWSLGAQAAELIFDAGQRHAVTNIARLNYDSLVNGYRNTVFQAFNDVENQLSSLRILEQESSVQQLAVASAQHSYNLSNERFRGGVTTYLEVLTAEQTLIQDQSTAISLQTRQFAASVGLVRSLGGGWDVTQLPH